MSNQRIFLRKKTKAGIQSLGDGGYHTQVGYDVRSFHPALTACRIPSLYSSSNNNDETRCLISLE